MIATESGAIESVANWNQVSQVNNGYPGHMVFDPQYPGHDRQKQNGFASIGRHSQSNSSCVYHEYGQYDNHKSQGHASAREHGNWGDSNGNYGSHGLNMWQSGTVAKAEEVQRDNNVSLVHPEAIGVIGLRSFIPRENFNHKFNHTNLKQNKQMHFSNDFYGSPKSVNVANKLVQSSQQFPYASNSRRSSAGRPPHALVTFGYGGKVIDFVGASISVLNLLEVVNGTTVAPPFPGPLVGGNVGSKEWNKIDDKIASYESPDVDYIKGENFQAASFIT
ncbi:hypothetical protein DITRI_Ditri13aG0060000 [Diplodiscus trichospermus]